ncbi:MAG: DUF1667 domain-containing protein [Clostridia bacterium]|nr:DUF1667 domain-containing protein [Clostridia bacterium]
MKKKLTCVECPLGCEIEVEMEGSTILSLRGNGCLRGKAYAMNEVICPKRVVTSTVRSEDGRLIPVKTDKPVKKSDIFSVMEKIRQTTCRSDVKIGDVLAENIEEDANLIVAGR